MARKVITVLTDDLDGGKADRTVEFSLDGVAYTIDVSDENAGVLRKALDPYISAGRGSAGAGRGRPRHPPPGRPATSEWTASRTAPSGNGPPRTATRFPSGAASRSPW